MQLKGKHALVTGAAKRVGKCIAETFFNEGAKLTLHYHRSKDEAHAVAQQLNAPTVCADLSKEKEICDAIQQASKAQGPIDILIHSASIYHPQPIDQVTEDDWDHMQAINTRGAFYFARHFAAQLGERPGVLIHIADTEDPRRKYTPYCVSKAGLRQLTKNLALEWAPRIRVNSVCPGSVLLPENYTPEQEAFSKNHSLMKRLGSPEDIARACVFLTQNDYITGQSLNVDGGRSLMGNLGTV